MRDAELEEGPFLLIFPFQKHAGAVDMSRNDMPAEPVADRKCTFHVHQIAGLFLAEIRSGKRFRTDIKAQFIAVLLHDGQAAAVDGDTVRDFRFRSDPCFTNDEPASGTIGFHLDSGDRTHRFNDT